MTDNPQPADDPRAAEATAILRPQRTPGQKPPIRMRSGAGSRSKRGGARTNEREVPRILILIRSLDTKIASKMSTGKAGKGLNTMLDRARLAGLWRWWQWKNPANWGFWLARHVPNRIRYYVVVWAWAQATTGTGAQDSPDQVRVIDCLQRVWPLE